MPVDAPKWRTVPALLSPAPLAFTTPNKDVGSCDMRQTRSGKPAPQSLGKVYFRRTLLPQVPPFQSYEVADGRVVLRSDVRGEAVAS